MKVELNKFEFASDISTPHLLITGGVHGDEFEPIAAIRELVELFSTNDSAIQNFEGKVTFVPCVNEEAFRIGKRCASDNLDLARTCPGRNQGTITERIAHSLSELIRSADFYIDLHTGGTEFSLYPLAGYMLHHDKMILSQQRMMAHAFNLNVVWGTSSDLEGRSLSIARDANVPAIYCEYLGAATCSPAGVNAYVEGCLNVMSALGMISRPQQDGRVEYIVEDDKPSSGHLQVCHPSPIDGFFEPHVKLGQQVDQGELLGIVHSLDSSQATSIRSEQSGIVLMLRTFPRILKGTSAGVVLDRHQ